MNKWLIIRLLGLFLKLGSSDGSIDFNTISKLKLSFVLDNTLPKFNMPTNIHQHINLKERKKTSYLLYFLTDDFNVYI